MTAHWHIGMEVECILSTARCINDMGLPSFEKGQKFKIAGIHFNDEYGMFLSFCERNPSNWGHVDAFRPIQKRATDISLFRALLHPSEHDKKALIEHERKADAEVLADGFYGEVKFS